MVYIRCPVSEKGFLEKHALPFESIADFIYLDYEQARKSSDSEKVIGFLEKHAKFDNLIFQDTMDEIRRVELLDLCPSQRNTRAVGKNQAQIRNEASRETIRRQASQRG